MRLVRSLLCVSLLCASGLSFVGVARANQVQETPPPPPPAPSTPDAPATTAEPPTSPEPKPTEPVVVEQPPAPPPAPATTPSDDAHASTGISITASTSEPADVAHPETHDGFFLRVALGLGVQAWSKQLPSMPPDGLSLPVNGGEATFGGVGGVLELAIGTVVTDNLAVHATLFGATLGEPTLTVGDTDLPEVNGRAFLASLLGVGATYYVMPANVYVSASFGLGGMRMVPKKGAKAMDTKAGFAWELLAGKEWWIGSEWGLGAALQVAYMNVPDQGERSSALVVNALLSVTYN